MTGVAANIYLLRCQQGRSLGVYGSAVCPAGWTGRNFAWSGIFGRFPYEIVPSFPLADSLWSLCDLPVCDARQNQSSVAYPVALSQRCQRCSLPRFPGHRHHLIFTGRTL